MTWKANYEKKICWKIRNSTRRDTVWKRRTGARRNIILKMRAQLWIHTAPSLVPNFNNRWNPCSCSIAINFDIGDRQTIMWTLIGDKPLETLGIIGDITRACKFSLLFCRQSKMGKSRDRIPLIWVQSLSALHIDIHLSWCTWPIYCILFTLALPIKCLCFGWMSGWVYSNVWTKD